MSRLSWREPAKPVADPEAKQAKPPRDARCDTCGQWMVTAPAGTTWVRGRCGNRSCKRHGAGQTVYLRE